MTSLTPSPPETKGEDPATSSASPPAAAASGSPPLVDGCKDHTHTKWGSQPKPRKDVGTSLSVDDRRRAVVETALAYVTRGLKYGHSHTPGRELENGLDCSNFTRWVFKKALGDAFDFKVSHVLRQSELGADVTMADDTHGEQSFIGGAKALTALVDGDLVYFTGRRGGPVTHVGIFAHRYTADGRPCVIHSSEAAALREGREPGAMVSPVTPEELGEWPLKNGPTLLGKGAVGGHALRHPGLCRSCIY